MSEREVLTPAEVGARFRVDTKTVGRWARTGQLPSFRTMGGHLRFYADDITRLVDEQTQRFKPPRM